MKKLSKEEMKKVMGGVEDGEGLFCKDGPCSLVIQGDDGNWITRTGTCRFDLFQTNSCYCDAGIGNGPQPVTSNGGKSRCWN